MRHSLIGFDDKNTNFIAFSNFSSYGSNNSDIARMKQILSKAIATGLTDRQRECVVMYYYDSQKLDDIAHKLSLSKSTVSRHIKAAKVKLKNLAKYY